MSEAGKKRTTLSPARLNSSSPLETKWTAANIIKFEFKLAVTPNTK